MMNNRLENVQLTPQERDLIQALRRHEFSRVLRDISTMMEVSEQSNQEDELRGGRGYPVTDEEWEAAERQADEDIAAGNYKEFTTMDEFIADLFNGEEE
jgi:hypothetical protein